MRFILFPYTEILSSIRPSLMKVNGVWFFGEGGEKNLYFSSAMFDWRLKRARRNKSIRF